MVSLLPLKGQDVRIAVLEEKLTVYEDLSKEMLSKLEAAVDKISEANQNVAKILVRHEERLDQSLQSDAAIMKLLDELKEQRKEDASDTNEKIEKIEVAMERVNTKITELSKYRWIIAGAVMLASFIVSEANMLSFMHDPQPVPQQVGAPK
jgi:chromosome segregation ATPase